MTWEAKIAADDGRVAEIRRLGPRRWALYRHDVTGRLDPLGEYRTRDAAIEAASERLAIHPRRWAE